MEDGFEANTINWRDGARDLPQMVNNTTESMLAELIDNSIEENATKIELRIYGNTEQNLSISVYDNGRGFRNKENLKTSFDLFGRQGEKKIGKFNIGMKLSCLSRCDKVKAYSYGDEGDLLHRYVYTTGSSNAEEWGTYSVEDNEILNESIKQYMKENNYKTSITLSEFQKLPEITDGLTPKSYRKYGEYLAQYFGVIYQNILNKSDNEGRPIKIIIQDATVFPLDPFWENFTPKEITRRLSLPDTDKDSFRDQDFKYVMQNYIPYGTIKTSTIPVAFNDEKGDEQLVYVTGYSLPPHNIATEILKDAKTKREVFYTGPIGSAPRLKKPNMTGLYFYRNGRCICMGDTGVDSNKGWYTLMGNVETFLDSTRIKIEFPDELDTFLGLKPTKDRVSPPDKFFDRILPALQSPVHEPLLRGKLGSKPRAFFEKNTGKKADGDNFTLVTGNSYFGTGAKGGSYKCEWCDLYHPNEHKCVKAPPSTQTTLPLDVDEPNVESDVEIESPPSINPSPPPTVIEQRSQWDVVGADKIVIKLIRGDPKNPHILDEVKEHLNL